MWRIIASAMLAVAVLAGATPRALAQRKGADTIESIRAKPKKPAKRTAKAAHPRPAPKPRPRAVVKHPRPAALRSAVAVRRSPPSPAAPAPRARTLAALGRTWTVTGVGVEAGDSGELWVSPRRPAPGALPAAAETRLGSLGTGAWRIAFDARFGILDPGSSGVCVRCAGQNVAVVAADSGVVGMAASIGATPARKTQTADDNWHHFELLGVGQRASFWEDGALVGDQELTGIPDALSAGAISARPERQTEMWLRGLAVQPDESGGEIDLFNGADLAGWRISDRSVPWKADSGVLTNARGRADDWLDWLGGLPADSYEVHLRLRILEGLRFRLLLVPDQISRGDEGGFYVAAAGETRNIILIGPDLTDIKSFRHPTYEMGQWLDLRLRVNRDGGVMLFLNDEIIQIARLVRRKPLRITVLAGDDWSPGRIEIAFLRVSLH